MRVQVQKEFTGKNGQAYQKGQSVDLPDAEAKEQIQQGNVTESKQGGSGSER
jgi:hypothetical protein